MFRFDDNTTQLASTKGSGRKKLNGKLRKRM